MTEKYIILTRVNPLKFHILLSSPDILPIDYCGRGYDHPSFRAVGSMNRKLGLLGCSFAEGACPERLELSSSTGLAERGQAHPANVLLGNQPLLLGAHPSPRSRCGNSSNIRARSLLIRLLYSLGHFVTVIFRISSCLLQFSVKSLIRKTVGDSFELNALYVNTFL